MPAIPERDPLGDPFAGLVLQYASAQALALSPISGAEVVAQGNFVVRYGVRFLGKPHLSIVPGLVALDYGDFLTSEAGWEFLLQHSNLHPRADVVGYRNDGVDDMIVVKQLDIMAPIDVLVYADAVATKPMAHPTAVIGAAEGVPSRLLMYLTHYPTLSEWKAALND